MGGGIANSEHPGLVSIEADGDGWKIDAANRLRILDPDQQKTVDRVYLETGKMYPAELADRRRGYIFTEPDTLDRCTFHKYAVRPNALVDIGSGPKNQILIENPYVTAVHARLSFSGGVWSIYDNHSTNGVYVNERRISQTVTLSPGDVIYILGVKIVIGDSFIAINNPDGSVSIHTDFLKEYGSPAVGTYERPDALPTAFYYRSPGFHRDIVPLEMNIDAPTAKEREDETPLALSLAPSLVMGAASFSSGLVTVSNTISSGGTVMKTLPTLVMSIAMLCGMVVFPFIMKSMDRKRKGVREEERRERYMKYLENMRFEIGKASSLQHDILTENYPFIMTQMRTSGFYDLKLWSRVIGQGDFLVLRVGTGNVPLAANLKFPPQRFAIDDDAMRDAVNSFSEERQVVSDVPVTISLMEHRVAGIVGRGAAVNGILHGLLLQIAALHSYDEVKVVFLCEERDLEQYSYVRWMQHVWDNDFKKRFVAATPAEVRELSAYFGRVIEQYREERPKYSPHYVVISTSKRLSDGCAFLSEILRDDLLEGFSCLAAYDELKNLPKECSAVIQAGDSQSLLFDYKHVEKHQVNFVQDVVTSEQAKAAAKTIADYRLDLQSGKYALPGMVTFLEMYRVGKYEHLNIASRWRENNPVSSLMAPVGINSDGGLFYLDLHENAHGPHGLVAGMTGSGKSEFIITYILSLAVNYSPDDVAFILIDYKGGGLVGAFENEQYRLPHLAGTITNLDGSSIARSVLAIQSELRRRQIEFNDARRVSGEGTMDIYKYQKLYRSGIVKKPVPHLFIISDEFAELKSQHAEFMTQLISTARIGRSLGVHLILATQKPGGVVDNQIWANSRFKVCLKVQDKDDSMEMLKRPDAAELVETGRFYLQVGYNELFEMGQSAWCGAPYIPTDVMEDERDESVCVIDRLGNVTDEAKPQKKVEAGALVRKQIVEIASYISQIADEEGMHAEQLWMPEIPAVVTVDELIGKYGYAADHMLNPVIGEVDDPASQEQRILTLPLSERGNAIVYGMAGSGKETFLVTLLYSLYRDHAADELNTYILDFGAETLRMFSGAPQTGDVVVSGEDEKIGSFFEMMMREMAERRRMFSEAGGDYLSWRRMGGTGIPYIVVLMNNYTNFSEQHEKYGDAVITITRDCTKYGIYFVLTCSSTMGIRYKLQQNFTQVFVLEQSDKAEYTATLGNTGGIYPSHIMGRGIYRDKDVYEFQTAQVAARRDEIVEAVRAFCDGLRRDGAAVARRIPMLPNVAYLADLGEGECSFANFPVGIRKAGISPMFVNMAKGAVMQVLSNEPSDLAGFAGGVAQALRTRTDCETYVFDPKGMAPSDGFDAGHYVTSNMDDVVVRLFDMTVSRHNAYKNARGHMPEDVDAHPVVVLLVGLGAVKSQLTDDGRDKLKLILEKTSGNFSLYFWAFDDVKSAASYGSESWCGGDGIWVGNGFENQTRLMVQGKKNVKGEYTPADGWMVRRGKAEYMKLLVHDGFKLEEEEDG